MTPEDMARLERLLIAPEEEIDPTATAALRALLADHARLRLSKALNAARQIRRILREIARTA